MFSRRICRCGGSATLMAMELANKLRAKGIDIIAFNVGEPDFDTPEHIKEAAVRALEENYTHYTPSPGFPELREAVAEKCQRENGIPCEAKHVIVTTTKFAIFSSVLAMVDEGDEVIIPEPAWCSYMDIVDIANGKIVHTGLKGEDMFRLTPEAVAEVVTPKTKLLMLNSPSNPTGGIIRKEDMRGMVELAQDHDFHILSDEIYEHILYEGEHVSPASFPDALERVITINGFSKAYAMTGWRMGYAIVPAKIFTEVIKFQQQAVTCASSFSQRACITALRSEKSKEAIERMVGIFRKRRDVVVDGLNEIPGIECPKSPGTFYAFPSYDMEMYDKSAMDMGMYLLEKGNVSVTAGTAFGPSGEGCFRVAYATSMDKIEEGLERLKKAFARLG